MARIMWPMHCKHFLTVEPAVQHADIPPPNYYSLLVKLCFHSAKLKAANSKILATIQQAIGLGLHVH